MSKNAQSRSPAALLSSLSSPLTRRHVRRRRPHPRRRVVRRPRRRNRNDARRHDARLLPQLAGGGDERVFVGVDAALSGRGGREKKVGFRGTPTRIVRGALSSSPLPPPCARALLPCRPLGDAARASWHRHTTADGGGGPDIGARNRARRAKQNLSMPPSSPPSLSSLPSHLRHLPRALLVVDPPV